MPIKGTLFSHLTDTKPKQKHFDSFADLVMELVQYRGTSRRPVTKSGVPNSDPTESKEWIVWPSTPALCPSEYKSDGKRCNADVIAHHWFFADIDNKPGCGTYLSFDNAVQFMRQEGWNFCIHTTTQSRPDAQRYRIILEMTRSTLPGEWEHLWRAMNDKFGGIFDSGARSICHLSFVPALWDGADNEFEVEIDASPIDVDQIMAGFKYTPPPPPPPPISRHQWRALMLQAARDQKARGYTTLVDPLTVKEEIVVKYVGKKAEKGEGGRFYTIMASHALSCLQRGYDIGEAELLQAGMTVNLRHLGNVKRPNAAKEAQAALRWATSQMLSSPKFLETDPIKRAFMR